MATATAPKSKTAGHNRLAGNNGSQAAEAQETGVETESLTPGQRRLLRERQSQRKIKTVGDREMAGSLDEAVVQTGSGLPDMRFAQNKNAFSRDASKTVHGRPDRRFLDNRPDILAAHTEDGYSNVIFSEDGEVE